MRQIEKLILAWTFTKYLENKLYYMIFKATNILKTLLTAYLRTSKINTERSKSLSWTAVSSKSYCSFECVTSDSKLKELTLLSEYRLAEFNTQDSDASL